MHKSVRLEVDGAAAFLTLVNVARRNCVNLALAEEIEACLAAVRSQIRVVVLRAEGPIFSAGFDLKAPSESNRAAEVILRRVIGLNSVPWIAQIDGGVIGVGITLVALCHVSIARHESWWWLPELPRMGRMPWGVMASLGTAVKPAFIMGAITTCERFSAADACSAGMLSMVVAHERLDGVVANAVTNLTSTSDASRREIADWWHARRLERESS